MTRKRPRDPNQLAKSIIDIATRQKPDHDPRAVRTFATPHGEESCTTWPRG